MMTAHVCVFCGRRTTDPWEFICEWVTHFFNRTTRETEAGPVCPKCAAAWLDFDTDGASAACGPDEIHGEEPC